MASYTSAVIFLFAFFPLQVANNMRPDFGKQFQITHFYLVIFITATQTILCIQR